MGWINRLLGRDEASSQGDGDQAVIITLDGTSLAETVYEQYDTATLEELLEEALGELGECDGSEHGETETRVFLYGPDANRMFKAVEPILTAYPLAAKATVIIRSGPPGNPQREIRLP